MDSIARVSDSQNSTKHSFDRLPDELISDLFITTAKFVTMSFRSVSLMCTADGDPLHWALPIYGPESSLTGDLTNFLVTSQSKLPG